MPKDSDRALDLDEHTARLGRRLFADVRQEQQARNAEQKRRTSVAKGDSADGSSFWDWLTGDADGGCDGGDGD